MQDTLVPPPVWPLPIDIVRARRAPDSTSQWLRRCDKCLVFLQMPPNNAKMLEDHQKSATCKDFQEIRKMYDDGFHLVKSGCRTNKLKQYITRHNQRDYYASPIASYHRWLNANFSKTEVVLMLDKFLDLTAEEQVAHIEGLIMQYEFAQEANQHNKSSYDFPF